MDIFVEDVDVHSGPGITAVAIAVTVAMAVAGAIPVGVPVAIDLKKFPELAEVVTVGVRGVAGETLFDDEVLEKRRNSAVHV